MRLSNEALAAQPKPQLVVWPETAFVPRIHWHATYRDRQNLWLIVRDLLEYLSQIDTPFLIGNNDARMDPAVNPNPDERHIVDYNAELLLERGEITEVYRKLHLVPFTEHFPYKRLLPFVYKALQNADTHFWQKGDKTTVFYTSGFRFAAPICFEDTFGYLSRIFVKAGADVLVNLTNDAWANSLSSQNQHLSTAVFRAVENNRSMVRSTTSGQTCAIDPSGRVTALARPFTEAWINVTVPIMEGFTPYTLFGDYLGIIFTSMAVILLLFGALWCTIRRIREGKQ
jgi:apolipoprotein N-acyltransferase